jgi:hypothetical protein
MFITPRRRRALVEELLAISKRHHFRSDGPEGERTKSIGRELNRRGGIWLMRKVYWEIFERVSQSAARDLEHAWDGIGRWPG